MNEQTSVGTIIVFWSALLIIVFFAVNKNLTSTAPKSVGAGFNELNEAIDGNR